jgi:hypothetical protein
MLAGLKRIMFRGEGQSAILPIGLAGPVFLLATDIGTSSVDFGVALGLEIVEAVGKVRKGGDSGSSVFVWAGYSC